jgi:hypothetical protein
VLTLFISTSSCAPTIDNSHSIMSCTTTDHGVPPSLKLVDPEKPPAPPPPFVERGLHANLTVLDAFLALFAAFAQSMAFGSFRLWYSQNQLVDYTAFDISWIGSVQLWVFSISVSCACCQRVLHFLLKLSIFSLSLKTIPLLLL